MNDATITSNWLQRGGTESKESGPDLDTGDDGLRQDGLQDVHGLRVILQDPLHNGLHPGGVSLHPQLG